MSANAMRETFYAILISVSVLFGFWLGVARCDCSLPATTGAGQGALEGR